MSTNINNTASTIIMNDTNTQILDVNGEVIMDATTLKDVADFVTSGNSHQHTTFATDGQKTRKAFVEAFGNNLDGITSLDAALKLSGLNFEVEKVPMYDMIKKPGQPPRFSVIPGHFNIRRKDNDELIGFNVSETYSLFQNHEAFEFLDSLVAEGGKFVNAGMFGGSNRKGHEKPNSKMMICMEAPRMSILGDSYAPYMLFRNGFDMNASLTCAFVNLRVFCSNAINRALKEATSSISIRHSKTMRDRIEMAHMILSSNLKYMEAFSAQAELMALKPFTEEDFQTWVERLVPIDYLTAKEGAILTRKEEQRMAMMEAYHQPDLDNFAGSAYRAIQAISDYESHKVTSTRGGTTPYSFKTVMEDGMPLLNKTWDMLLERV